MHRVRIGLTGLAFVFLAVLLAAVFTRTPPGEAPLTPNLIDQPKAAQGPAPAAAPSEPLAQLGVAPGGESNQSAAPPAAPPQ